MNRVWAMRSTDTFDCIPIGALVKKYLAGSRYSVDVFARNKDWATATNDLSPNTTAMFHMESLDFLKHLHDGGTRPDVVLFDPPYSLEQCKRSYESVGRVVTQKDTQTWGYWREHKKLIADMLVTGGRCISFGWNSSGIGKKHGFEIEDILLVCHGPGTHDTICTVERKVQSCLVESSDDGD